MSTAEIATAMNNDVSILQTDEYFALRNVTEEESPVAVSPLSGEEFTLKTPKSTWRHRAKAEETNTGVYAVRLKPG